MTQPEKHRGRPLAETASEVIRDDDPLSVAIVTDSAVRCRRCRHALTADRSVQLGVGPRCRHLEHGEAA